jgi:hypothetical protein
MKTVMMRRVTTTVKAVANHRVTTKILMMKMRMVVMVVVMATKMYQIATTLSMNWTR